MKYFKEIAQNSIMLYFQ